MKFSCYFIAFIFLAVGCATAPQMKKDISPQELYKSACGSKIQVNEIRGSIWLKTRSPELTGQFSVLVYAKSPDLLRLEFTNILGGSEATLLVRGNHYEVTTPHIHDDIHTNLAKIRQGDGSWGGIPLRWAVNLFLGKIPCPDIPVEHSNEIKLFKTQEGELEIGIPDAGENEMKEVQPQNQPNAQKFIYKFKMYHGKPLPIGLHWERVGQESIAVDFKFDDPDDVTLSPKKWEASSNRGAIKVKWQDREVQP